jgi:hypothetical protein
MVGSQSEASVSSPRRPAPAPQAYTLDSVPRTQPLPGRSALTAQHVAPKATAVLQPPLELDVGANRELQQRAPTQATTRAQVNMALHAATPSAGMSHL